MCHAVRCRDCGKVTWAGCGDHVDQALADFPADDLCQCDDGAPAGQSSVWSRFLSR